jgi:hypothetical protein
MAKVIILSRKFPAYHPKSGQPTHFPEKYWQSLHIAGLPRDEYVKKIPELRPMLNDFIMNKNFGMEKNHTIRLGRRWKDGDAASIRIWSDKPYRSKQIALDSLPVKLKVIDIVIDYDEGYIDTPNHSIPLKARNLYCFNLAKNDGLGVKDLLDWFEVGKKTGKVDAQILIWGTVKDY